MLGSTVAGRPVRSPAVITSSIILTKPSTSSASVELAGVPAVSCVSEFPTEVVTGASITISPSMSPSLLYAAAVAVSSLGEPRAKL